MIHQRDKLVTAARSLYQRGLTHGSTGNVSVRVGDKVLVTPTGASLGTLLPGEVSVMDVHGKHLSGPRPSKEAFLHAIMLRERPTANAVVHTHSTYSAAVSCLADIDSADAIPALTAYFAMRVGKLPLLPYYAPGDTGISADVARAAADHSTLLLSNHGPVIAGADLAAAIDALDEIEHTAKIFLLLHGMPTRPLTEQQRQALVQ
ncbi:3-oxo-tetronate 4-phosphate decarboxylase [Kibdelosporangium aridum]|uniref:3-oxo-tetronate 4-phosphate decarboxylase n=1 Tax=Kibdelosporangium aridum TaxID=2030 RepID=A0A1Y5XPZ2_KIBAR|nr:3-oxo-tetronate 4-phosphate decarboxylase [Kibdelosporangium aridum]SMD07356.1 Ribulose-5-phosphate 4-epimerase/Fuculose-1-phosphate aldolase [Kibdelosporangium aridum]